MKLISSIAFIWAVRIATLFSSALVSIVTARSFGPTGRGLFTLPAIDVSIAVAFSVGLSSAASYHLLKRKAGPQIVRALMVSCCVFALVGAVATIFTAETSHSAWAIAPALTYMCFYGIYTVVCGYYFGRDRARTAAMVSGILSFVTLVFVLLSVWKVHSAEVAVMAWVTAIVVVATLGLICITVDARKLTGQDVNVLSVMRFGAKAGVLNVANLLNYRVDIIIVATLLPVAALGLYTIAVTAAESALSLTLAVAQATVPRIGSLDRAEAGRFAARCLRNTLFLAAILCGVGMVAAPLLVELIFGSSYAAIVTPLRILLAGILAASTTSIISNYFVLNLGRTNAPLTLSVISTVICGALSAALIPRQGLVGAAVASTIAYIVSQTVAILYFCKTSGTKPLHAILLDQRDVALYVRVARRAVRLS